AKFTKGLQAKITMITDWKEFTPGIWAGETLFQAQGWTKARRVIVIREHKAQLEEAKGRELFDDPRYLYQGVVTNKTGIAEEIWRFYRGRADMENRIKETKYDYGINGFCLKKFYATEAAFRLVCFLHNLMVLMQKKLGYVAHRTLGSLRYELLSCGAILGKAGRRLRLRISLQGPWRDRFLIYLLNLFPSQNPNCAAVESG
ncbi:MAG: transposase, partial [Elusimicrobiota bacterium]